MFIAAIAVTGLHSCAFGGMFAALNSVEGAFKRWPGMSRGNKRSRWQDPFPVLLLPFFARRNPNGGSDVGQISLTKADNPSPQLKVRNWPFVQLSAFAIVRPLSANAPTRPNGREVVGSCLNSGQCKDIDRCCPTESIGREVMHFQV